MLSDLRFAFRTLSRTPLVTLVAILSLALGIGGNTAMFSLLDQILLRGLPVPQPGELVALTANGPAAGVIPPTTPTMPIPSSVIPCFGI